MMQENQNNHGHARVRHVPIHVESREGQTNEHQRANNHHHQHFHTDHDDDQHRYYLINQQQYAYPGTRSQQYHDDHANNYEPPYSSQTLPNTSSININYQPNPPQRQTNASVHDVNLNNSGHSDQGRQRDIGSASNKENDRTARSTSRSSDVNNVSDHQNSDKLVNSPEPIPLPPPPEISERPGSGGSSKSPECREDPIQQEQTKPTSGSNEKKQPDLGEAKKPKTDNGPIGLINATKTEVHRLLCEISEFNGVSPQAKEYLKLDELLTRCTLKLDTIQCSDLPELRQQRKAVYELIDKCTDLLQRKTQLNYDMQQLYSKCS